jgi:hypothetical protein
MRVVPENYVFRVTPCSTHRLHPGNSLNLPDSPSFISQVHPGGVPPHVLCPDCPLWFSPPGALARALVIKEDGVQPPASEKGVPTATLP